MFCDFGFLLQNCEKTHQTQQICSTETQLVSKTVLHGGLSLWFSRAAYRPSKPCDQTSWSGSSDTSRLPPPTENDTFDDEWLLVVCDQQKERFTHHTCCIWTEGRGGDRGDRGRHFGWNILLLLLNKLQQSTSGCCTLPVQLQEALLHTVYTDAVRRWCLKRRDKTNECVSGPSL